MKGFLSALPHPIHRALLGVCTLGALLAAPAAWASSGGGWLDGHVGNLYVGHANSIVFDEPSAKGVYGRLFHEPVAVSGLSLTMTAGTVQGAVFGVDAGSASDGNLTATGNTVHISGGTVPQVFGVELTMVANGNATASGNMVRISGGTVSLATYGGIVTTSKNGSATASGNTIEISGTADVGRVYGGIAYATLNGSSYTGTATATGNTIIIRGGKVQAVSAAVIGFGQDVDPATASGAATGNEVHLYGGTITDFLLGGSILEHETDILDARVTKDNKLFVYAKGLQGGQEVRNFDPSPSPCPLTLRRATPCSPWATRRTSLPTPPRSTSPWTALPS